MDSTGGNRIRILAVEDDPIYAETIRMIISEAGYHLIGIPDNGKDALKLAVETLPDLILMDIQLVGGMSGIDVMRQLDPDIPVIVITSNRDQETFDQLKKLRPFTFLLKPFDALVLANNVALALAAHMGKEEEVWNSEDLILKDYFFIKEKKSLLKVAVADILYIESEDKYCTLVTPVRKHLVRISLKEIKKKIPQYFIQTHRSYILNVHKLDEIDLDNYVLKVGDREIPVAIKYKEQLISLLQKL